MKVSFIIVHSSTKLMSVFDSKSWPAQDYVHDRDLENATNNVIEQITRINIDKEIIILDNTGDFNLRTPHPDVSIHESYGMWVYKNELDKLSIFDFVKDKFSTEIIKSSAAETCSMCFNHGLTLATGDYIIFQHNDTLYLNNFYDSTKLIKDSIEYLEKNNLEYLTVDAKPAKENSTKKYGLTSQYFADCYWFLCRGNFFTKNNIWVDWERGDCNHLATIYCENNSLKYEHLPMFNEGEDMRKLFNTEKFVEDKKIEYPELVKFFGRVNVHFLQGIPFLIHAKGGTGLGKVTRLNEFVNVANNDTTD